MSLKAAKGAITIIDRATKPLQSVSNAFKSLSKSSDKADKKIDKNASTFTKASKKLNRLNRTIKAGRKSLAGYASGFTKISALGSLLLGGGLVAAVNQQAEALDKLGKKAGNLQLPTDELQAMYEQAQHAGLSTDEMGASLTRFTKRLGVFQATGGGLMGGVVKKISPLLAAQLKGAKSNKEAYELVLKTYKKLPTQQAKMALADAAFGMSGRKSLLMLEEGVDGLIAARKRLKELGGGASEEDIKAAADYNDAMQDIGFALKSLKFKALTPVLKEVTKLMLDFTEKFKNADYRDKAITKVKVAVMGVFNAIRGGITLISSLKNHFEEVALVAAELRIAMFALNAVMYANPTGLIVAAIAALISGLVYAYRNFEGFRKVVDTTFSFLKDGFLTSVKYAKIFYNSMSSYGKRLKDYYTGIIEYITDAIQPAIDLIKKFENLNIGKKISGAKDAVAGFFGDMFDGAKAMIGIDPSNAVQTIQQNSSTNVPVAISVSIADGQVRGVESKGATRTDVFLNNGSQY